MWKERLKRRRYRYYQQKYSKRVDKIKNLSKFAKLGFICVIGLFLLALVILPLMAFSLPSPDKVVRRDGFSTKILDRNGETLYDIFEDKRQTPVELDEIPLYLRQATVAIEDKNFYNHEGFDIFGILRGFSKVFTRGRAQGGSTLTQQLVKNVLLTSERSIWRKMKEVVLAIQIERKYDKDEILKMYLNEAPYGGTAWGVESASETYFGKKVKDLNLTECVILAGLPQRPSYYSPYSSTPKAYVDRAQQVLRRMKEDGYITPEQEEEVKKELAEYKFQERGASFKAPHFVQYVQKLLEERYGEQVVEQGGLKVTTTLDLNIQEEAQKIVAEEIAKVETQHITNGAAIVLNSETGEILSMVGSKNFNDPDYDGQVNVTTSLRQPGSAIKPITYVAGFKKGYTPATLIMDVPTKFPGGAGQPDYEPGNYDGKFRGPIQVRYALGNSINIPAVKMLAMVGIKDVLRTAYDLGLSTLEPTDETLKRVGLSLTLGGGEVRLIELTSAYAPFMNKGYRVDPVAILKVEDKDGKVLEEVKPEKKKRVLSEEEAYLMAHVLSDNSAREEVFGTNSLLNIPNRQIAVKTGTTNDRRDNWTVGGNPQVVVGVWVGNNDNSPMKSVASGVSGASPIWRKILLEALKEKPNLTFEMPSGIVTAQVDRVSGYRAHDGYPDRTEYFIKGTEPGEDKVHVKVKVCKNDGKLATPGDILSGNYDEKEYFLFKEEDPTSSGGANRWQEAVLAWMNTQGDERYHPPSDYCGSTNPLSIDVDPGDHTSNLPNEFKIKMKVDSTSDISWVQLDIDGAKIAEFGSPPYEYQVNLSDGTHSIRVKARDKDNHESERTNHYGINVAWDWTPATPVPSPTPTATPAPTATPVIP